MIIPSQQPVFDAPPQELGEGLPKAGAFEGLGTAVAEVVPSIATRAIRTGAMLESPWAMAVDKVNSAISGKDTTAAQDWYFERVIDDTATKWVDKFTPNADDIGAVGRTVHGLATFMGDIATQTPIGMAANHYTNSVIDYTNQYDPETATKLGAVESIASLAFAHAPVFGKGLAQKIATATAGNLGLGIASRGIESKVLQEQYPEDAANIKMFDENAIMMDVASGILFGGASHYFPKTFQNERKQSVSEYMVKNVLQLDDPKLFEKIDLKTKDLLWSWYKYKNDHTKMYKTNTTDAEIISHAELARAAEAFDNGEAYKPSPEMVDVVTQGIDEATFNEIREKMNLSKEVMDELGVDIITDEDYNVADYTSAFDNKYEAPPINETAGESAILGGATQEADTAFQQAALDDVATKIAQEANPEVRQQLQDSVDEAKLEIEDINKEKSAFQEVITCLMKGGK